MIIHLFMLHSVKTQASVLPNAVGPNGVLPYGVAPNGVGPYGAGVNPLTATSKYVPSKPLAGPLRKDTKGKYDRLGSKLKKLTPENLIKIRAFMDVNKTSDARRKADVVLAALALRKQRANAAASAFG